MTAQGPEIPPAASDAAADPATPAAPALNRFYEPIILTGKTLPAFVNTQTKSFRVGAVDKTSGMLKPIPFQTDERNDKNNSFMYDFGPGADQDDTPGVLDSNDEIVFMARDAGPRLADGPRRQLGPDAVEVKITDPKTGGIGYAYAFRKSDALAVSKAKLVSLEDPGEGLKVTAEGYSFRLARDCQLTFDYLALRQPGDTSEVNIMDRLKVRGWVKLFGFISAKTNECDWTSHYYGAVDGNVRVIRRTKNSYTVAMIPSVRFDTELVFYPNHFEVAITGRLPFDLKTIAPQGGFAVYADYNDNAKGAKFYTGAYTNGVTFDGTPKVEPSVEVLGKVPYVWGAIYGIGPEKNTGWFSRVVPGFNVPTRYAPQVIDNDRENNPPEQFPGVHEIGFKVDTLDEMKGGRFAISSILYRIKDWEPKDAQKLLNVVDSPLAVELSATDGSGTISRFTMPTRPNEPPIPAEPPAPGTPGAAGAEPKAAKK